MTDAATPSLAGPVPGQAVLIYDGDCGFCTTSARWAERRLGAPAVAVQPWQALDLDAFGLTEDDVTSAAQWVDPSGEVVAGHLAAAKATQAMGGLWAPLGAVLQRRPVSWLAALLYRLVARYRYRLPGATDACRLPQP